MKLLLNYRTKDQIDSFISKPAHALGLLGSAGAGKSFIAQNIIATTLDSSLESVVAHPYVYILDAAGAGGIEQVRELQAFLKLKVPGKATIRRIALIEHADMLRHEAQNALLKTLEEPPVDTIIICTIASKQHLLSTITSRLQWITVQPLEEKQSRVAFEKDYSEAEIKRAYYLSEGNAGLMTSLLDKNTEHPLAIAVGKARSLLQASRYDRLREIDAMVKGDSGEVWLLVDALQRLLQAAMHSAARLETINTKDLANLKQQLTLVLRAKELLEAKVQPKLTLTWLFHSL
jgi:DNA polymerase-3 subunit delta'